MFNQLQELIKSFSFQTVLRGNILSSPSAYNIGGAGGSMVGAKSNSPASNMVSNRYLSTYYQKMQEIKDYEQTELSQISIGIYKDYISGYFNTDGDLITISEEFPNAEKWQAQVNSDLKDLDIINEVKLHMWDILYDGTWCFKKAFDPLSNKYVKFNLQNPHNVVSIFKEGKRHSHLVVSREGTIYEVKPESIFRIGMPTLNLINDINSEYYSKPKDDTLVKDELMMAAMPLYYNITGKVKEYLLKEQLLSLLSIKDLIQPLMLLLRLDKNTSTDVGNRLALNMENMINKYSDISSILGSNFSINSLIDSLMNNIRVIPDYHQSMGDMNTIDLSKFTNKVQEIEDRQDSKKESILTAISIPRSLFNGESTKWDAIKSSQRLNNKVNNEVHSISNSIKLEACELIRERSGYEISPNYVTVNLFKKTDVDYNVAITNTEIIGQLIEGIQRILSGTQQLVQEVSMIDKEAYITYVYNQLKIVDPEVTKFFNESTIKQYIKQALQSNQMQ